MNKQGAALAFSDTDSSRFGLRVLRGVDAGRDARALLTEIVDAAADVVIFRVPAGVPSAVRKLGRFGLHPLHADTLVEYDVALSDHEPRPLRNADLVFAKATPGDAAALQLLVAATFDGYVSHYHANPLFGRAQILAGYAQWACGYLASEHPGLITWVAKRGDAVVAFACCSHGDDGDQAEGVLYGVDPANSGGGVYGDLIRFTQGEFKRRGFRRMKVSTQIWNFAVQKVWAREGFTLTRAWDTYHVNAMLSAGEPMASCDVSYDAEQIAHFASVTGDSNDIHQDPAAAAAAGFDGCIAPGMLTATELSRIFGTQNPGPGTLFSRCELIFLAPVYAGRPYRLEIRAIAPPTASGHVSAVATLRDTDGGLCLLAYNDLLKRS